ncbi:MAG: 3'-5' exonuclease, partial [Candidatus Bathyarchaeia archaeon]
METLEKYFSKKEEEKPLVKEEGEFQELIYKPSLAVNLSKAYFVGAGYDGEKHLAFIKLYEPEEGKIYFWYDDGFHKPYCFSKQSIQELQLNEALVNHDGFERFEEEEKYDALEDRRIKVTKIIAKDPLSIGGRPSGSIRDILRVWEADIKYTECYIYDKGLIPGMPYKVENGKLIPIEYDLDPQILNAIKNTLKDDVNNIDLLLNWAKLLECPVPKFLRAAVDIEVYSPIATRMPSASEAEYPVI